MKSVAWSSVKFIHVFELRKNSYSFAFSSQDGPSEYSWCNCNDQRADMDPTMQVSVLTFNEKLEFFLVCWLTAFKLLVCCLLTLFSGKSCLNTKPFLQWYFDTFPQQAVSDTAMDIQEAENGTETSKFTHQLEFWQKKGNFLKVKQKKHEDVWFFCRPPRDPSSKRPSPTCCWGNHWSSFICLVLHSKFKKKKISEFTYWLTWREYRGEMWVITIFVAFM